MSGPLARLAPPNRHDPRTIDDFAVDWGSLVITAAPVAIDEHAYLLAIAEFTNIEPASRGIFAMRYAFAADPAFDELLRVSGAIGGGESIAARFLGRTTAAATLGEFGADGRAIEDAVEHAIRVIRPYSPRGIVLSPFGPERELAELLFTYGMYEHYADRYSADDALATTRELLADTVGPVLEERVAIFFRAPWGAWFDPHSCSDATLVMFQRRRREAWLLAVSHSD